LILEAEDPDYLNEGALDRTPLCLVLGGMAQQPRNLKLARLLLERGACPNLRIPAPDMESASESPLVSVANGPKFRPQNTKGPKKIVWGRENLGPNFWQIYQVLHQSSHIFGRPL
jgi:hypothetical protein